MGQITSPSPREKRKDIAQTLSSEKSEVPSLFIKCSLNTKIADFLYNLHLSISLLSMRYRESGYIKLKTRDMEHLVI